MGAQLLEASNRRTPGRHLLDLDLTEEHIDSDFDAAASEAFAALGAALRSVRPSIVETFDALEAVMQKHSPRFWPTASRPSPAVRAATVRPRAREHRRGASRASACAADDGSEPPLACAGCGEPLPAPRAGGPGRRKRYHSPTCRTLAFRARARDHLAHEELVLEEVAAGRVSAEDGILWTIFPDEMRRVSSTTVLRRDRRAA